MSTPLSLAETFPNSSATASLAVVFFASGWFTATSWSTASCPLLFPFLCGTSFSTGRSASSCQLPFPLLCSVIWGLSMERFWERYAQSRWLDQIVQCRSSTVVLRVVYPSTSHEVVCLPPISQSSLMGASGAQHTAALIGVFYCSPVAVQYWANAGGGQWLNPFSALKNTLKASVAGCSIGSSLINLLKRIILDSDFWSVVFVPGSSPHWPFILPSYWSTRTVSSPDSSVWSFPLFPFMMHGEAVFSTFEKYEWTINSIRVHQHRLT